MVQTFESGKVLEHPQLNNMIRAINGDGVVSGFAVSQRAAGGANMSVDVALGEARIDNAEESEAGLTNLAIDAAHATLERKDLITYDASADIPAVVKGTDHAGSVADPTYPPDLPSGDILLGIVKVNAAASSIVNADITDGRILVRITSVFSYSESDTLQKSNDSEESDTTSSYVKIKELTGLPECVVRSSLRIKFSMKSGTNGYNVNGQIRRNGVAIGTERATSSIAYTEYSEDVDGWLGGDTIELWVKYATTTAEAFVKEFRAYGTSAEHPVNDELSW